MLKVGDLVHVKPGMFPEWHGRLVAQVVATDKRRVTLKYENDIEGRCYWVHRDVAEQWMTPLRSPLQDITIVDGFTIRAAECLFALKQDL